MSSTLRGYERHKSDYYITPIDRIEDFLKEFVKYEEKAFDKGVLDPCAGGDSDNPMSYPTAIHNVFKKQVDTIDIRDDSLAVVKADFTKIKSLSKQYYMIITNPPFDISKEIINKSLELVEPTGFVVMLLRLNYFGGKVRMDIWDSNMPKYCFVHNNRMSFTKDGKRDSIEYAHFVWQKGYKPTFTNLKVIK